MKRTLLLCSLLLLIAPHARAQQAGAAKPADAKTEPVKPAPTSYPAPAATSTPAAPAASPSVVAPTPAAAAVLTEASVAPMSGRAATVPAEKSAPIRVPRFEKAPAIDGKLDDEVWKSAVVLKDFYQISPGDNIAPSKPTEVLMGYDARFLYFAFRATDEPDKVRATVAKRDDVFGEDNIRVYLDTFNDQRRAYLLGFNPLGVQQDGIYTEGQGTDFSVDIVMESKGMITPDGYTVEVAIPFKSLRYTAGKDKLWGIHVWRNIDRFNDEMDSWVPISRDKSSTLNQEAHLTGLEGISTERTLELIPSFTVSETGKRSRSFRPVTLGEPLAADPGRMLNRPVEFDPGLTAKWGITPTVTLDLALNPDFAQVEADATVNTANQRFPIFFEEKRPFFLEGIDIFRTIMSVVHTRTIVDPDVAAKLSGKRGKTTFGLLVASDNAPGNFGEEELNDRQLEFVTRPDPALRRDGQLQFQSFLDRVVGKNSTVGVLRVKRDVGKENAIGLIATTSSFVDRNNYLGGFDGRFRFDKVTTLEFQVVGTNARRCALGLTEDGDECATLNGLGYAYSFNQDRRHTNFNVNGAGRTEGFRSDVGFTRRRNTNNHNLNFGYHTEPKPKATVVSWETYHYFGGNFDWQGRMQNWTYEGQAGANLQRQTFIRAGYNTGYERVFAFEFGEPAFASGRDEHSVASKNVFAYAGSTPSKKYSFFYFFGYRWGEHDFDFGAGPRFPRVSPSAIASREAREAGLCDTDDRPSACLGPLDPGRGNLLYTNGDFTYKPTNALNASLSVSKNRLTRNDTGLVAFDSNIVSLRTTYQFTRFTFARARVDYSSLSSNFRGQFLLGWTPNPGTAFYAGYNDDLNRSFFNPFTSQLEPGFRRNGRTFFVKMSYLIRKSFGE
ncbi:MAG TPA: DUF5916 domain-containing protein [Pyrinomonadaceae bacterium]|jgi:hypothetical protein|nr:DUF5916 domain-containing protein [Pyrinomonadaceae bacterium]